MVAGRSTGGPLWQPTAVPGTHRITGGLSDAFARDWYAAREAGERLRSLAMEYLYANPRHGGVGGRHPDPRRNSAFSLWSMLQVAAFQLGLELEEVSNPALLSQAEEAFPRRRGMKWVWLLIYPGPERLTLAYRVPPREPGLYLDFCFQAAELLGDIYHRFHILNDPDHPSGYYEPATDRGTITCLHQFAIAFLHLEESCPPSWHCDCNALRARFSAAPPEHAQPTDALLQSEIMQQMARREKIRPTGPNGRPYGLPEAQG